jgi:hypothetical protein
MRASLPVSLLLSVALGACGGKNATNDAAGGGGGIGGSGVGGSTSTDAAVDRSCGSPATTYTFVTERIRVLNSGRGFGITLLPDGTPLFYYWGTSAAASTEIWALGRPEADDGGVSVSLGYQLSRGPANAGFAGLGSIVRATSTGEVRITYWPYVSGNPAPRYIEWSGDFNQTPIDTAIDTSPLPSLEAFALDPQDRPGVVYLIGNDIYLARNLGTGWQSERAWSLVEREDIDFKEYLDVALTFDSSGTPVLFPKPASSRLYVATKESQGWTSTLLDPRSPTGIAPLAGRNGFGQIEVVFHGGIATARRAVGLPGAWDVNASVPSISGSPHTMVLGSGGEIHLAYDSEPPTYAYYDGCSWSTQLVTGASRGLVGMAVDASGRPHMAFHKSVMQGTTTIYELWYAHPAP